MPDTVEFTSRVGPDGMLNVHIALGEAQAGADVVVTIRPASPSGQADPGEWHRFVNQTYGSCDGLGLERQPQGEFEAREALE